MPSAVEEESLRRRIHDDEQTTTSVVEANHTVEEERISTVETVELGDISHHDQKNLVQQSYQGVQGVSASVYETTTKNQDRTQQAGLEVNDTEGDNTDEDNAGQLFMDIRNRAAAADLTDGQEQVTMTIHGFYHFGFFATPSHILHRLTSHPGIRCLAVSELHIDLAHPEHRSPSSREPGGHTDPRSASADRG